MQNILTEKDIITNCESITKEEAIKAVGRMLVEKNCVKEEYIQGMINRDNELSVYIGNKLAIPHGEASASQYVDKTGLAVMIYPNGIDWNGEEVKIVIGIGAKDGEHMDILASIAVALMEEETVDKIVSLGCTKEIYSILTQ